MQVFSLEAARADGWLDRLGEGAPSFQQLCELMGERFVAFSVIAGVRIVSVHVNPRAAERSVVEIVASEGAAPEQFAMGELRRRLGERVLAADDDADPDPAALLVGAPDVEALQRCLGFRWVLLAPLYGYELRALVHERGAPLRVRVARDQGDEEEVPLEDLRDALRTLVRVEIARAGRVNAPFSIDLALVPEAIAASERGDHERVVALVGQWPGPLSVLLRTADGQNLAQDARGALARALGALGTAHCRLGKVEWGQEVLRLGLQWAQDGAAAAELFARLGEALLDEGRAGEAIGVLRRGLALGAPEVRIAPALARAFEARERHLAALLWAESARARGGDAADLEAVEAAARAALGEAWTRFRAEFPPGPRG